jgi:hypothetical protein
MPSPSHRTRGASHKLQFMVVGADLPSLSGYPFEVRYSDDSLARAKAAADLAAAAYSYLSGLFGDIHPDIAVVVAGESDWPQSNNQYGLPFFRDDPSELRPGIVVMPATPGDFWVAMADSLRESAPEMYPRLLATYPDGAGGLDLQPFFDLITVHELGHAFEVLGDLRLPTHWLSEIFVNLALHTFVATRLPQSLEILEVLPTVGAASDRLAARMRATGYSTLDQSQSHYPGWTAEPMTALNYIWFQYRWQRLAAEIFSADGEHALGRLWECFHARDRLPPDEVRAAAIAPLLVDEVSATLGFATRDWE